MIPSVYPLDGDAAAGATVLWRLPMALNAALRRGDAAAVKEVLATAALLSLAKRIEILGAADEEGTPGFAHALANGHTTAMTSFVPGIDELPSEARRTLLTPCHGDGVPSLAHALTSPQRQSVADVAAALASLPEAERIAYLSARGADGATALNHALRNGHPEALPVFVRAMAGLPAAKQAALLHASDGAGMPALFHALAYGHDEVVRAYVDALRRRPGGEADRAALTDAGRLHLALAKDADGNAGLAQAVRVGHHRAMRAFKMLAVAALPAEKRSELLEGRDATGTCNLRRAFSCSDPQTVMVYCDMLRILPRQQQVAILTKPDREGMPALAHALKEDRANSIQAFVAATAHLPEADRILILAARDQKGRPGKMLAAHAGAIEAGYAYQRHAIASLQPD